MVEEWPLIQGKRFVLKREDDSFPQALREIPEPPSVLYGVGNASALTEGLAVVGARNATPYGIGCAKRFSKIAAERGVTIISGGARGCDSAAHRAALEAGAPTVVFLGGGCDRIYPKNNYALFQEVVDKGGCLVSEHPFEYMPLPFTFRARNRLIAGLAKATLIVEAGLPSGTFSTADEALSANKDVLVVPGSITSKQSRGANRLLYQGAVPIVDDETFADQLFSIFGLLKQEDAREGTVPAEDDLDARSKRLLGAINAEPLGLEELNVIASGSCPSSSVRTWLMIWLADMQRDGRIVQYPDGKFGPKVIDRQAERLERGALSREKDSRS